MKPCTDRFTPGRNTHLDPDPTDDELQCEMEDEGPERDMNEEWEENYTNWKEIHRGNL